MSDDEGWSPTHFALGPLLPAEQDRMIAGLRALLALDLGWDEVIASAWKEGNQLLVAEPGDPVGLAWLRWVEACDMPLRAEVGIADLERYLDDV